MSQADLWSKIDNSLVRIQDAFAAGEAARDRLLERQGEVLVAQGKMLTQIRFQWIVIAVMVAKNSGLLDLVVGN